MGESQETASAESRRNRTKRRPFPLQDLASRTRQFFDPQTARLGFRSGVLLIFSALVAAHMPVVTGIGYAPWNLEVILTLCFLGGVSLVASGLLHRFQPLLYLFVCFWIYWTLDAYLPDEATLAWAPSAMAIFPIDLTQDGWTLLQNVSIPAVIWILLNSRVSDNLRAMIIAFSGVWFIGLWTSSERSLLTPTPRSAQTSPAPEQRPSVAKNSPTMRNAFRTATGDLRPVIHFILDEQMSPQALPNTLPGALDPQTNFKPSEIHPAINIINDYTSRGFTYYSHVRSISSQTQKSLASLMGLEGKRGEENLSLSMEEGFRYEIKQNNYVESLRNLGYHINIVQNNFLMLCPNTKNVSCLSYYSGKTGGIFSPINIDPSSRLVILLTEIHRAYGDKKSHYVFAYSWIDRTLKSLGLRQSYDFVYYSNPVTVLNLLHKLQEPLNNIESGQAYIIHLLMPHFPYMTNADCRFKNYTEWSSPNRHLRSGKTPLPVEKIYRDYWDQSACIHGRIISIIDSIRENSKINPIFFVHGDHGSRITGNYEELENPGLNNKDMLETFLAVSFRQDNENGIEVTDDKNLQSLLPHILNQMTSATTDAAFSAVGNP